MENITVNIDTEFIPLNQLLKLSGIADSGSFAHHLIEQGQIYLQGKPVSEKRRKIYHGYEVIVGNEYKIIVQKNED